MIDFLSKEESATTSYAAMESDDYIAKIVEVNPNAQRQKYDSMVSRGRVKDLTTLPANEVESVVKVVLLAYGLKSGDSMKDVEGKPVEPLTQRLFKDVSPFVGFSKKTGMPSDYRCLFGFALRQDPSKPFTAAGIEDIIGKYVGVEVAVTDKGKNKVVSFKKVPDSFKPNEEIEKAAMDKFNEQKSKKATEQGGATSIEDIPW